MHVHVTSGASGLYMENNWFWTADHDIDSSANTQITVYTGRGVLIESRNGPIWLSGTASEHSTLYQYQFSGASNIYSGFMQTETPYYQPNPVAPRPWPTVSALNDPTFGNGQQDAWGLRAVNSNGVFIYGAGFYSFFNSYSTTCSNQAGPENCQSAILDFENTSNVRVYNLNTVGTVNMIAQNGGSILKASHADNVNSFPDTIALYTQ